MPRLVALVTPAFDRPPPVLARSLWQCLVVGLLLVACLPAARNGAGVAGPWIFWLVGAPVVSLLVLYRRALALAWQSVLVRAPRRRRPRHGGPQARRNGYGRAGRQQPSRAA